jgi:hypothetical protein
MDETPRQPREREEVVERREIVERDVAPARDPDRVVVHERTGTSSLVWAVPLLIVVALLLWYVMSRGEPTQVQLPDVSAPQIEAPTTTERIEIQLPERQAAPSQPAAPAAEPAAEPQP